MKNNFKSYAEITADRTKMARSFAKQMGVNAQKVKAERNRIDREKRERVLMRGF
jgi:hypothetical protein